MRIISKYHDYYDTAMGYGIDPGLVYHREREVLDVVEGDWICGTRLEAIWESVPWGCYVTRCSSPVLLLFCGKVYPFWLEGKFESEKQLHVASTFLDCVGELDKKYRKGTSEWFHDEDDDYWLFYTSDDIKEFINDKALDEFNARSMVAFSKNLSGQPVEHSSHHHFKAPVLLIGQAPSGAGRMHYRVIRNPILKDLGFYKVIEPFTAYQEIAMFLGGVMGQSDKAPLRVGSDEVIAKQKGFDDQSFRTASPGQKKLNRKANKARKRGEDDSSS